jgi:hypothetical protein
MILDFRIRVLVQNKAAENQNARMEYEHFELAVLKILNFAKHSPIQIKSKALFYTC